MDVLCQNDLFDVPTSWRSQYVMDTRWETPQAFFDTLDREFHFTIDVAALPGTAKCARYYTPETDGLKQDWTKEVFWMNPPYGRRQNVYAWVEKAFVSVQNGATGVCLLPMSGDTRWFHDFCLRSTELRFVRDRLWFSLDGKVCQRSNHANIIVVFKAPLPATPKISSILT